MSDFLSGLVDRAFERSPMLERRRPSRFEPPTGVDGRLSGRVRPLAEDQATDDLDTFELPDAPARRPTVRPPRQPARPETVDLPEERPPASGPPLPDRQPDAMALEPRRGPKTAPPIPGQPRDGETRVERSTEHPARVIGSAREAPRNGEDRVVGRVTAASRVAPPDVRPPLPRPPVTSPDRDGDRKIHRGRSQSNRVEPAVSVSARSPQVPFTRRQPSEPTIHVTIGRVEVRAVSAPPTLSGRASRPSAPKLSLDDYLKSRGGVRT
jgi:hypothetical protein